jgi:outer membrane protein OmpA-like peptidoglycan-associated protein
VLDKCPDQAGPADNMGCPNFMKNSSNQSIDNSEDYYLSMTNANFVQKDTIQFYTFFDLNSARLTQNSFVLLNKVVDFLKRNNEYRCLIAGHSDIEGDIEANMKISEKRANIVKSYISSYGIADVRLQTSFYGKSQPLPIYDKNLKWMNRRVEVLLMKVK